VTRRTLASAGGLALVYALTLASTDPVDLALGAALGAALAGALANRLRLGPRGEAPPPAAHLLGLPLFAAAVLADVAQGTWDVGLRVLHVRPLGRPGLVRVPMGERSERGVAVSALATTLSPGSVLVDLDWERRDILLHVIDASDPDGVRERLQRFYDRYQWRVFP
jgi:multicomponent Na+:H+ antiporter subunit E